MAINVLFAQVLLDLKGLRPVQYNWIVTVGLTDHQESGNEIQSTPKQGV